MRHNQTLRQIKRAVRDRYAFPGGYEMHLVMYDGEMMCMQCARKEWRYIYSDTKGALNGWRGSSWHCVGADIYWEGPPLQCCNCNRDMESEYGDPDEKPNADNSYDTPEDLEDAADTMFEWMTRRTRK